jgi:5S rRNA maturation endonuclease (ribonuclease M5)
MSRLNALKSATTLNELASLLRLKPAALSYVLFKHPDYAKYTTFEIPKRSGGTRVIQAPINRLKLVQRKLSDLLQDCAEEINVSSGRVDLTAHGFRRDHSIITNAWRHRHRRFIFNIDLEDFFPSIHFGRVQGFFKADRNFMLHDTVARLIAQIACHEKKLPQGSPCSPVISNLIGHVLDIHLVALAAKTGCRYSRYADDLTFSTNLRIFPPEIATQCKADPHLWLPGKQLEEIISHSGFRIQSAKTHMQYRTSRQEVTGLVVNEKINVRCEYRHTVRAMVHRLFKTGSFETLTATPQPCGGVILEKKEGTLNQLHGMLGFVDNIDLFNTKKSKKEGAPKGKETTKELMYRRFLIYKDFYTTGMPVVVCEGKTDTVYLTHAIRSLAVEFPELATITPDGKTLLNVRIYKYLKSGTARILGLSGGDGAIANFITKYRKDTQRFEAPGQKKPVIILYDNDKGANAIRGSIRGAGVSIKGTEPFVHVFKNLYAVPTPLAKGKSESAIEDFFSAEVRATKLDGKTFNPAEEIDTQKEYGKNIFAHKVVKEKASFIDFTGFRPLLTNLEAVINAHATAVAGESSLNIFSSETFPSVG